MLIVSPLSTCPTQEILDSGVANLPAHFEKILVMDLTLLPQKRSVRRKQWRNLTSKDKKNSQFAVNSSEIALKITAV